MNIKSILTGAGIGVLALVVWGQIRYSQGRADMRDEILAIGPVRDTVIRYVEIPAKPDTMRGTPRNPHNRATMPVKARPPVGAITDGSGGADVVDDTDDALAYTYVDTLDDSHGGTHELTFTYPSLMFTEIYTPGPDSVRVVTVTELKYVPADEPRFSIGFVGAYRHGVEQSVGGGVSIGYMPVKVSHLWIPGGDVTTVSYEIRF